MKLIYYNFCITLTPIKHFPHHRDAKLMKIMGITQNFGKNLLVIENNVAKNIL